MFLTEELASLLSVRKSFSDNLEGPKSPNYPLDINHAHNTDFNKLANFCQVKKFSHIFNHWYFSQSVFIFFFHSCHYQKPDVIILPTNFHCEHWSKNL